MVLWSLSDDILWPHSVEFLKREREKKVGEVVRDTTVWRGV
jgi:hypothetical protein